MTTFRYLHGVIVVVVIALIAKGATTGSAARIAQRLGISEHVIGLTVVVRYIRAGVCSHDSGGFSWTRLFCRNVVDRHI